MGRLAPLRRNLDFLPSPVADRPGLLIRDPYQFAPGIVLIPAPLLPLLAFFDGQHSRDDLVARLGGGEEGEASALVDHVERTLSDGGFLEDGCYARQRADRIRSFRDSPVRAAVHAGNAYPSSPAELSSLLAGWMGAEGPVSTRDLVGIAAPHVSPDGGFRSYVAAYRCLAPVGPAPTFLILGTSHYGEPDTFALTRKPFVTPCGQAGVDLSIVEELAAAGGTAVLMEDYTHAVEHSVEFQVLFLQHLFGPGVRIVPVLCGPFLESAAEGYPEDDPRLARFFAALRHVATTRPEVTFVLGVDLAHVGRRYGDPESARAQEGPLEDVARQDADRLARLDVGDVHGFWDLVRAEGDELRWCGSSPLYTFARSVPYQGAELLRYEQWNIDEHSVVTFAGLAFGRVPTLSKES